MKLRRSPRRQVLRDENFAVMAFDKFPDHTHVVQAVGMDPWGYSELMLVEPSSGDVLAARVTGCSGGPGNYTQFTHEARVRPARGDVLTIREYVTKVASLASTRGTDVTEVTLEGLGSSAYVFNDVIAAWKPDLSNASSSAASAARRGLGNSSAFAGATNATDDDGLYSVNGELTELFGVLDHYDPVANTVDAANSYTMTHAMCGEDAGHITVIDWSHASAVSVAESLGLLVVSLRNIDTVAAVDARTGALAWTLSAHATVASDFAWLGGDDAKMYDVHGAYLVEELDFADDAGTNASARGVHRLLAFDGGNNRPGCEVNYTDCYSRAVEYELDLANRTARLSWQFAYPYGAGAPEASRRRTDMFVKDGGSALLFANDASDEKLYYVAFTSTSTSRWRDDAHIFVVDASGAVRTEIAVRRSYWSQVAAGLYRALPSKSVYGESEDFPFTSSH